MNFCIEGWSTWFQLFIHLIFALEYCLFYIGGGIYFLIYSRTKGNRNYIISERTDWTFTLIRIFSSCPQTFHSCFFCIKNLRIRTFSNYSHFVFRKKTTPRPMFIKKPNNCRGNGSGLRFKHGHCLCGSPKKSFPVPQWQRRVLLPNRTYH